MKKVIKLDLYMCQLPTNNVTIMYYKHVLIKKNRMHIKKTTYKPLMEDNPTES